MSRRRKIQKYQRDAAKAAKLDDDLNRIVKVLDERQQKRLEGGIVQQAVDRMDKLLYGDLHGLAEVPLTQGQYTLLDEIGKIERSNATRTTILDENGEPVRPIEYGYLNFPRRGRN